jgi:murein L,D-transpeptidase YafK
VQLRVCRTLLASAAVACALALASCDTDSVSLPAKAVRPLSPDMYAEMQQKSMPTDSPVLVRIFKEESELEIWKQDSSGKFAHLKTYPICRWSGELGPKVKQGDRQAPEGFYTITPAQMNPNSNYYLSFNLGFPNAYDRANNRDGAFLMVHGDCSSAGCYAMTDEQIGEIFALGRDSFFGGQKAFQVQAYPFRMTPLNMARHRNNPAMPFWRMIKQGYDVFEVTREEPKVDVCDRHYVFNAVSPTGAPLTLNPHGACPAYRMPEEIASAVKAKETEDERKIAEYTQRGTATVPAHMGTDGGMHAVFLARWRQKASWDSYSRPAKVIGAQPGDMGNNVNPPHVPGSTELAAAPALPADAESTESPWQKLTASVSNAFGSRPAQAAPAPQPQVAAAPAPKAHVAHNASSTKVAQKPAGKSDSKPQQVAEGPGGQAGEATPAAATSPAPTSSGGFDGRWSAGADQNAH